MEPQIWKGSYRQDTSGGEVGAEILGLVFELVGSHILMGVGKDEIDAS